MSRPNTHLDMDAFDELTDRYMAAMDCGDEEPCAK